MLEGIRRITTQGCENKSSPAQSASFAFPTAGDLVLLTCPTGHQTSILRSELHVYCMEVLGNPFPDWPRLIPSAGEDRHSAGGKLIALGSTASLQVFVSLFHLVFALMSAQPDLKDEQLLLRLYGGAFRDLLKEANALVVPSLTLQKRITEEDKEGLLFQLGRLYRCEVEGEGGWSKTVHYKPYNTPIAPFWEVRAVGPLNSSLKDEYDDLLD